MHNVGPEQAKSIDLDPYTVDDFTNDIMRLGENKPSKPLVDELVNSSREAIEWLAKDVGIRFVMAFNRQAYEVDGRQKFWGGLVLSVVDGGKGLIEDDHKALERAGVEVEYETPVTSILLDEDGIVHGVRVKRNGVETQVMAKAVIMACGGFEANKELRRKYLGDAWVNARVSLRVTSPERS